MCKFCDEKGLPCLLCGAATMRHQFDRRRCGACAYANRPTREWPVFRFCPYCGRDLGNKTSEDTEEGKQEDKEMERYTWTADQDEVIRGMILEGKTVADICDRMGCTDTQLKNHVAVVRRRDPSFPTLCGEVKGERFVLASSEAAEVMSGEPRQIVVGSAGEGTVEPIVEPSKTEEKKADLNPLEKQMADIIAEQKETIDNLRVELETEQEARELEAEAYRNETKRLTDLVNSLKGTVSAQGDELAAKDKLIEKVYGDLEEARKARDGALEELEQTLEQMRSGEIGPQKAAAEIRPAPLSDEFLKLNEELCKAMDEVANLSDAQHERDEVIFAMAKAIFLGPKEVLLA